MAEITSFKLTCTWNDGSSTSASRFVTTISQGEVNNINNESQIKFTVTGVALNGCVFSGYWNNYLYLTFYQVNEDGTTTQLNKYTKKFDTLKSTASTLISDSYYFKHNNDGSLKLKVKLEYSHPYKENWIGKPSSITSNAFDVPPTNPTFTVTTSASANVNSVTGAGTYKIGDNVNILATVSNFGYSFDKFILGTGEIITANPYQFTMPAKDVTITAYSKSNSYALNLAYGDGNWPTTSGWTNDASNHTASKLVVYGTKVGNLPAVSRNGYNFLGWYTAENGGTKYEATSLFLPTSPSGLTLYPHWEQKAQYYTVTLLWDAGIKSIISNNAIALPANGKQIAVAAGTKLDIAATTVTGYSFKNWIITVDGVDSTSTGVNYKYVVNANTTITAETVINTYSIVYDANGGTGAPDAQIKKHGVAISLSAVIPIKAGYVFLGWAKTSTAKNPTYYANSIYTTDANLKLYAVWREPTTQDSKKTIIWVKVPSADPTKLNGEWRC